MSKSEDWEAIIELMNARRANFKEEERNMIVWKYGSMACGKLMNQIETDFEIKKQPEIVPQKSKQSREGIAEQNDEDQDDSDDDEFLRRKR